MRDVIILTQFDPLSSSPDCLSALDHQDSRVVFASAQAQRINILALQQQQLPCVLLVDEVLSTGVERRVPATAMISILPMAAGHIQALLDAGAADELLARARYV